jgi:NAD+ kinase
MSTRPKTERRSCLQVGIERNRKTFRQFHVLNDAVLSKGSLSRIFEFNVEVDGQFLSSYRADGLIVSSPTGSTAYNLAAGGSILDPTIPAVQLTPICPQSFSNQPIVVSDHHRIDLSVGRHSSDVFLTLDGHTGLRIEGQDRVRVEKSGKSVGFLLPPGMDWTHYFHSLRQKLKWGLVSGAPK